jgi:hypothetical protein
LIRAGDYRFGVYLSHPPLPTCAWSGSPSCFLFSLTLDIKIPYHARHHSSNNNNNNNNIAILGDSHNSNSFQEPNAMFVQPDRIFFGNGDLTIENNLENGTSELENSYGLGMEEHSVEALCLLAGTPFFIIDELEVWSLVPQ